MWDDDICRCDSIECPHYYKCYRGRGHDWKPGIYTFALFFKEDEKCEYFIEGDN